MAHHVQDHAAAVFLAVVPAGALDGLQVAFKHPVAELQAHRQHLAEEACAAQHVEFAQAGQEEFVLHRAVFQAGGLASLFGQARDFDGFVEVGGNGFFAVHMFAGTDGFGQQGGAHLGGAGVEEHRVVRVGQCGVEVGAPAGNAVFLGQCFHLFGVAADEDGVGHDLVAVRQCDAALGADRADGADQVLVHAHTAGDAVHDDSESLCCHVFSAGQSVCEGDVRGWGTGRRLSPAGRWT